MMQKVQRWSQPCCTWTKARVRPVRPVTGWDTALRAAMMSLTAPGGGSRPGFGPQLFLVAQHAVHAGQRGPGRRVDLDGAAGDDDPRARPLPHQPADGAPGLMLGLGGDGAGMHHHQVVLPVRVAAHDLALVGVQAAAEGDDLRRGHQDRLTGLLPRSSVPLALGVNSRWMS